MRIQGFRGNCDSQASWGCAPVLPNRIREVFLRAAFRINRSPHKTFLHSPKAPCNLIGFVV